MIFLDRITTIPTTIDLKIPTSLKIDNKGITYINVDCGDAKNKGTIFVDGGSSNSLQSIVWNCTYADLKKEIYYNFYLNGGGAFSTYNDSTIGGFADTIQKLISDGGIAQDENNPQAKIGVVLKHITTDKVYLYAGVAKEQNSLYITMPFMFNEVPPVGQYDIVATNGDKVIFKGILQIGKIENKNKSYKIINNGEQHEI